MRASTLLVASSLIMVGTGCGASLDGARPVEAPSGERSAVASPAPLTDRGYWVSAADTPSAPPARVLFRQEGHGSILIGEKAPPPEPERPRSRGRVDVSFHRAELDNALRFLADAGRFNLVVETGLSGSVTAELRGVDAFDALVSIAEANGASVRYQRGIVMVKKAAVAR